MRPGRKVLLHLGLGGNARVVTAWHPQSCVALHPLEPNQDVEIKAVCETKEYFALLQSRNHGHIYDKNGFSWGTPEEFRAFIQQKTGLKIQKVQ